jgi:hypothetical protein
MPVHKKKSKLSKDSSPKPSEDHLEVTHTVDPPPISETIRKVSTALEKASKAAVKTEVERQHRCRICGDRTCRHYEREYLDTGEEFDLNTAPDLDGKRL